MSDFTSWADERVLATLWDATLKGTLLLTLAGGTALLAKRASAAARHLMWSSALVGMLLLPILSLLLPEWRVPWMPRWLSATVVMTTVAETRQPTSPPALAPPVVEFTVPPAASVETETVQKSNSSPLLANTGEALVAAGAIIEPISATEAAIKPHSVALCIWFGGLFLSLAPLVVGTALLGRLTRRCSQCDDPAWTAQAENVARQLGLRRPVVLNTFTGVRSPLTWGVWRPVLLLPLEALHWSAERRRVVLLHELAHVKRFDWLTQSLAYVACAVYWFNPLAWWAARRMRAEREAACDDVVLAAGSRPADYADELLKLASAIMQRRLVDWVAVPMARKSTLEGRLLAILDGTRNRSALTRTLLVAATVLLAAVAVPVAMMQAAAESETELANAIEQETDVMRSEAQAADASNEDVSPKFGPVIQRVILAEFTPDTSSFDLEEEARRAFADETSDVTFAWRGPGSRIVIGPRNTNPDSIIAYRLWTQRLSENDWDGLSAEAVREMRARSLAAWPNTVNQSAMLLAPGTYAFATESGFGLLRVGGAVGPQESPDGVKVQFKFLRLAASNPSAPPASMAESPGAADANQPSLKAVRIVFDLRTAWFEGQATTWDKLPELLSKVPDPTHVSLEFGVVPNDAIDYGHIAGVMEVLRPLVRKFGFANLRFVGRQPFDSKGTPAGERATFARDLLQLRLRVQRFIDGAPIAKKESGIEIIEPIPGRQNEFQLRKDVERGEVLSGEPPYVFEPTHVLYRRKGSDHFYATGGYNFYYGPLAGDPETLLGITMREPPEQGWGPENQQPPVDDDRLKLLVNSAELVVVGTIATDPGPQLFGDRVGFREYICEFDVADVVRDPSNVFASRKVRVSIARQALEGRPAPGAAPLPTKGDELILFLRKNERGEGYRTIDIRYGALPADPMSGIVERARRLAGRRDESRRATITPQLRERIEGLIKGAPVSSKISELEIYEPTPGVAGDRIRVDVARREILDASARLPFYPLGEVFYLKENNQFYIQWDGMGASTRHYYGPFDGDPADVLGFPVPNNLEDAVPFDPVRALVRRWLDLAIAKNAAAANKLAYANGEFAAEVFRHPAVTEFEFDKLHVYERAAIVTSKPVKDERGRERIFVLSIDKAGRGNDEGWRIRGGKAADPAEARELVAAFTAPPIVDKVVDRTLHLAKNEMLDLDGGKVYQAADGWDKNENAFQWLGARGIEVQLARNPNMRAELAGVAGMLLSKQIDNNQWEQGNQQSVAKSLEGLDVAGTMLWAPEKPLPATYAIRTMPLPNGRSHFGLLQIVAHDQENKTVTMRYRLFASEPAARNDDSQAVDRTADPVEIVAWGEAGQGAGSGLTLGFGLEHRKSEYRPGDKLWRKLYLRNHGSQAVSIEDYVPLYGWYPQLLDANGQNVYPQPAVNYASSKRVTRIEPGGVFDLGSPDARSDTGFNVPLGDLSLTIPDVKPGSYSIRQTYRFNVGGEEVSLTSGDAPIRIAEPAAAGADGQLPVREDAAADRAAKLNLVVTSHLMLLDGKRLVTLADVDQLLAGVPKEKATQINVIYTLPPGASSPADSTARRLDGLELQLTKHGRTTSVRGPLGHGPANVWYDSIRTVDDLVPDPDLRREGIVQSADGTPLAGAQVILTWPSGAADAASQLIVLDGPQLAFSPTFATTRTDDTGRFDVHPSREQPFYLVVLHERGFALVRSDEFAADQPIRVQPWGKLSGRITSEAPRDARRVDFYIPIAAKAPWPPIAILQRGGDLSQPTADDRYEFSFVPPNLDGVVSRRAMYTDLDPAFRVPPGGMITVDVEPLTDAQFNEVVQRRRSGDPSRRGR